jgi:Rieske Fe-S protein
MTRRSFFKWATHALGVLFGTLLGVPALAFLADPRNRPGPPSDFRKVGTLGDLEVGVPKKVVITDTRRDAWTLHPRTIVGQVWLIRRGPEKVEAYTARCPHLGGSINFDGQRFVCPLHGASFNLSCHRLSAEQLGGPNPAPRDMDPLPVELVGDPSSANCAIEVKYEEFVTGVEERQKKS